MFGFILFWVTASAVTSYLLFKVARWVCADRSPFTNEDTVRLLVLSGLWPIGIVVVLVLLTIELWERSNILTKLTDWLNKS